MMIEPETFRNRGLAIFKKSGFVPFTERLWVRANTTPFRATIMPRVLATEESLSRVTRSPLMIPTAIPPTIPATTPAATPYRWKVMASMVEKAMLDPTDRSSSPTMIRKAMPITITPSIDMKLKMFTML